MWTLNNLKFAQVKQYLANQTESGTVTILCMMLPSYDFSLPIPPYLHREVS